MSDGHKMQSRCQIPAASQQMPHTTQLVVRKSRFLARSCHCPSVADAREFAALIKKQNPQASHNCFAFVAGYPGDTSHTGFSDDGEPHGTAGRPMLKAIQNTDIGEVCVVVSRWFGGIKLGTGGLGRAYQTAVLENLASLPLLDKIEQKRWQLDLPYGNLDYLRRLVPQMEAKIETESFGASAQLILSVPIDKTPEFEAAIKKAGNGCIKIAPMANNGQ